MFVHADSPAMASSPGVGGDPVRTVPAHPHYSANGHRPKWKNRRKPKIHEKPENPEKPAVPDEPPFAGTPGIGCTVSDTGADVDGMKAVGSVGLNTAVSECGPGGSVLMNSVKPPDTDTALPSGVVPSSNWIVPVASEGATFARKITGMP